MNELLPHDRCKASARSIARSKIAKVHNAILRARKSVLDIWAPGHIMDPQTREAIRIGGDLITSALIMFHFAYINEQTKGDVPGEVFDAADTLFTAIGLMEYPALWEALYYSDDQED